MAQSDPTRDGRDAELWALLPPKDESYDLDQLSEGETAALVEALGRGYGGILAQGGLSLPLPSNEQFALLENWYHAPLAEYDRDKWGWHSAYGDDAPCAIQVIPFPFHFNQSRLRIYFQNQFDRFCLQQTPELEQFWVKQVRLDPTLPPLDHSQKRSFCENQARAMLYQKPCYEFYALYFLDWIESKDSLKYPKFSLSFKVDIGAQLGRLVEQYYWRFRFEEVTLSGIGARKGASAGGQAKARLHRTEYSAWQEEASSIWARSPNLSKHAVAEQITKRLGVRRSARHIARYIKHP
jgi:hypothetical protein